MLQLWESWTRLCDYYRLPLRSGRWDIKMKRLPSPFLAIGRIDEVAEIQLLCDIARPAITCSSVGDRRQPKASASDRTRVDNDSTRSNAS